MRVMTCSSLFGICSAHKIQDAADYKDIFPMSVLSSDYVQVVHVVAIAYHNHVHSTGTVFVK